MTYTIPLGYAKRQLFDAPSAAQLRRLPHQDSVRDGGDGLDSIVRQIACLDGGESYCLRTDLLGDESSTHYKKHAPVISVTSDLPPGKTLPRAVLEQGDSEVSGYGWWSGNLRKVPFVKLIDGAKLFAYEAKKMPDGAFADVKLYDDTPQVRTQGALAAVQVSSRSPNHPRYTLVFSGIPADEQSSWRNVRARGTCCLDKLWRDARYAAHLDPMVDTACAHVVAGYHKIAQAYFAQGNKLPAQRSPFPVPSQALVDFAKRLDQVYTAREQDGKMRYATLNEAEAERLLVARIRQDPAGAFGGKLLRLDWT